ncbi:VWA domain-containing protein [Actinokineospora sp. PR83]|uniref:vWA domain-containing protein n=1 Tax=Actinokineospora sp. PR83 TaxID=2884908 RepID=UPI001F40B433|nr:VWA domain-containing protein [Actinokineospora sp. PR83]MCG8918383.1 VWA domain-containing protein [Actinokineospora sp. PR83]
MAQPTQAGPRKALLAISMVLGLLVLVVAVVTVRKLAEPPEPQGACVPLEVSVSTEKDEILAEMADRYNAAGRLFADDRCATVTAHGLTSGTSAAALAQGWDAAGTGMPAPQVWLPSTSLWERKISSGGKPSVALKPDSPSLMSSPVVLAMPKPMADVLLAQYPRPGWNDLIQFSKKPWKDYGHPEWGQFVLGRDNPLLSSSGLGASLATYHAAALAVTGRELTEQSVEDPAVEAVVHGVESSVGSYGDDAALYAEKLFEEDQKKEPVPYISAIVLQEQLVHLYNVGVPNADPARLAKVADPDAQDRPTPPNRPLTTIYPKDGTVVFDHPFIVLAGTSGLQRAAAEDFRAFLGEPDQLARFAGAGFRLPVDADGNPAPPTEQLRRSLGVPGDQALTRIETPSPALLDKVVTGWQKTRRTARVLVVLDVSGSMNDLAVPDRPGSPEGKLTKLELLKPAVTKALDLLGDNDQVGLWTFSTGYREVLPMSRVGDVRPQLGQAIAGLTAVGNTDLYNTVNAAQAQMAQSINPDSINAIVLLSDGANHPANPQARADMLGRVNAELNETSVRIYTIPYGADADRTTMVDIADATRAVSYDAQQQPLEIDKVFASAFSNL